MSANEPGSKHHPHYPRDIYKWWVIADNRKVRRKARLRLRTGDWEAAYWDESYRRNSW